MSFVVRNMGPNSLSGDGEEKIARSCDMWLYDSIWELVSNDDYAQFLYFQVGMNKTGLRFSSGDLFLIGLNIFISPPLPRARA